MAYPQDGFLPGFEQIHNPNVATYGYATDGPARIMNHMTVSHGISPGYIASHRVPPQLWANVYDGRRYQTGSLLRPGKALYQPQWGSPDSWTNRHGWTIQIEHIGVPEVNVKTYTDAQDRWIGEQVIRPVIQWFRDMGIPYDETAFRIHDDTSGSARASWHGRMSMEETIRTGGMVAHIDEWENDHWDCSVERLNMWLSYALGGGVVLPPPPPPPPVSTGVPNGHDVAYMQQWMTDRGFPCGPVDGDYGPKTTAGVANFQATLNSWGYNCGVVDGDWGPNTTAGANAWHAAGEPRGGAPTPPPVTPPPAPPPPTSSAPPWPGVYLSNPTSGGGTAQWQQQMANRGWSISVDDEYGPQSEGVCIQFQSEKGLGVDGIVGPVTWAAAWNLPVT